MDGKTIPHESQSRLNAPVFVNDVVTAQVRSETADSMVSNDLSRVLIIYTGGTIGMKHSSQTGYSPVPGYLTQTLAGMSRFHEQPVDGVVRVENVNELNTVNVSVPQMSMTDFTVQKETDPELLIISGTICRQKKLVSLLTPPSLYNKRTKYSILEYEPLLDSSNMTMSDWVRIATDIEVNYRLFDAFVILHGTDTMSYTASSLSFMLEDLGKTVIITGSQVPLAEVRNDAVENLLGALTIAGHFVIPEVGLFFDNKLFRGNRTSKVNALDFNAFDSPNLRPLVNVGINIDVSWTDIWRPKHIAKFRAHKHMEPSVATLRLFPGITESTVRAFLAPPIKGAVLETYGSGNAPNNRPELLVAIKEACDRGVVIVNCSQCKRGLVTDLYETGKALLKIGVVPGADMTPECALTKLSYLLSRYDDVTLIRKYMKSNLRGELTIPARRHQFSYLPHKSSGTGLVGSVIKLLGLSKSQASQFIHAPIHEQDSLITDETHFYIESPADSGREEDALGTVEKALVPSLLCQAARSGDKRGVQAVLEEFEYLVNLPDYDGRTPLHVASAEGRADIVEILLTHGGNVHLRDRFGHTPLFDAVRFANADVVTLLRKVGGHFSPEESNDVTAFLCRCAATGDYERLCMFIECGADLNASWQDNRTPLHLACANGHEDVVRAILDAAVSIQSVQRQGSPSDSVPVKLAAMEITPTAAKRSNSLLLASIGEGTSMARVYSQSSFAYAAQIRLEAVDAFGMTPLEEAKRHGYHNIVSLLQQAIIISSPTSAT